MEIRVLVRGLEEPLFKFFERNKDAYKLFHPHPFTMEAITDIINTFCEDYYCVVVVYDKVIGYGMLRGLDDGFNIPSLGIMIDREWQGHHLGRVLMGWLHLVAAGGMGVEKIRLTVGKTNLAAVNLYKSLGYELKNKEGWDDYYEGFLTL
jgi:ribosomal protein S18 acetylase RimI-like enzyme